jgi:hypothetical protein
VPIKLRPEVQAFAEAMQQLLDEHQDEKGDAWKTEEVYDLLPSVQRATERLFRVIYEYPTYTAQLVRVGEAAASIALHAMFVADVTGALPPVALRDEDDAVRMLCEEGLFTDGDHHKQWFLEQILVALGHDLGEVRAAAREVGYGDWEPGVAP